MPKEAKESMRISLTKKKKKRISTKYIDISKRNSNYRVEKYIKWKEKFTKDLQLFEMLDKEFMNSDTSQLWLLSLRNRNKEKKMTENINITKYG